MNIPSPNTGTGTPRRRPLAAMLIVKLVAVIVILAAVGWWFYQRTNQSPAVYGFNGKTYHAVFMSNGQVYFGKLTRVYDPFVTIEDIYYLRRLEQPLQPINTDDKAPAAQDKADLQLVKLGAEVHGPTDRMTINRQHILFIEELKADSQVVQTIEKDRKK